MVRPQHGGLVALTYLLDHRRRHPFKGAIISAPLLGLTLKVPPLKLKVGQLAARLLPRLTLPSGLPPASIPRDPVEVDRYKHDRRRVDKVRPVVRRHERRGRSRLRRGRRLSCRRRGDASGTGDLVCDPIATLRRVDRLVDPAARHQSLRSFDGYYHELHNEPELLRQPIKEMLLAWVEQRLQSAA